MNDENILITLASEVRFSLAEILKVQKLGNFSDEKTKELVSICLDSGWSDLEPLCDLLIRGANVL